MSKYGDFSGPNFPVFGLSTEIYPVNLHFQPECRKFHVRKSLLFNGQHVWIKKEGGLFDVTMGAFDGAEVCEAVGNFLLHQLSKNYNKKHIGLYRDDGLAIFKNVSGSKAENILKDIQKLFKDNQLNITIQCNLKIVNYLDVTFNLSNATYRSFCKTNNEITYIHKESNHPPSMLRQIPLSIESRLSKHSSNANIFKESAQIYHQALKKSGYDHQLKYQITIIPLRCTKRFSHERNIIISKLRQSGLQITTFRHEMYIRLSLATRVDIFNIFICLRNLCQSLLLLKI